jgi:EAL domain-containing protein (putative c-di-GMP-specific phosphodiesterase class I)
VLSRFEDEFGPIYPDEFIPQVKELGKTWEFTTVMIESAMTALNENKDIPEGFKVSFNLFPSDFMQDELLDLDWVLDMNDKKFKLVLEITEDEQLATASAVKHIKALKSRGFWMAIDDFGVGYSNLSQLKSLKCEFLKIDRSFVMDMEDHSIRSSLIPHIVSIADELRVTLIAEGVENTEQCQELVNMNVEYGQGWLFGKPQTVENLANTIELSFQTH